MKFKVKALINFNDMEENKKRLVGEEFECSKARCDFLLEHNAVEVVEQIDTINLDVDVKDEIKKAKLSKKKK